MEKRNSLSSVIAGNTVEVPEVTYTGFSAILDWALGNANDSPWLYPVRLTVFSAVPFALFLTCVGTKPIADKGGDALEAKNRVVENGSRQDGLLPNEGLVKTDWVEKTKAVTPDAVVPKR